MMGTVEFPRRVTTTHHFGGCPKCGDTVGYMNIKGNHFFVCEAHNTAWCAGYNLFSDWGSETQEQWEANEAKLRAMHIVQPVYPDQADWVRG